MGEETLLETYESMARKKLGMSRVQFFIACGVVAVVILVVLIFGVSAVLRAGASHLTVGSDLIDQEKTTTISLGLDDNGELQTETTTETTGIDKDGNFCATKETRIGTLADAKTNNTLRRLDKQMNGKLGAYIDGMTGDHKMSDQLHLGHGKGAMHEGDTHVSEKVGNLDVDIALVDDP